MDMQSYEPYFKEPRLSMTIPGRIFVRVASYIIYLFLGAATFTLLSAGIPDRSVNIFVDWGFLFLLFLIDRIVHYGQADTPLYELPKKGEVNAAKFLRPRAYAMLERGFDKSAVTGSDFYLSVANELLSLKEIEGALVRLDVKPKEFREKVGAFLKDGGALAGRSRAELKTFAEALVVRAFSQALDAGHIFI